MKYRGEAISRIDGASKAEGSVRYTDDLPFDGLHAGIVRSEIAYGNILSIHFDEAFDFSEYVWVDYREIEGRNVNVMLTEDQPFLAEKSVRFIGEPILLIAHASKERVQEALKAIYIEYEVWEPVLTLEASMHADTLLYSKDNIFKTIHTQKGEKPDYEKLESLEKVYTTPHQEQLYLETQRMLARYRDGNIKIIGSMQCPFYVASALYVLTGKKVEVEQAPTGGAFGGKEDYPSLMAGYVYLLSKKAKRDVKLVYDRAEDIAFTTKRHPAVMRYKSYFDKRGKLHALHIDIKIDGGAYVTLTPVVLARAVLHCAGFYECEFIEVHASAYATNTPPNGAFRGFGAPQAIFGIERHIDDIAHTLGISPLKMRKINLPNSHSLSVTGAKIEEYARLKALFEATSKASDFERKYEAKPPYRGIGMALFMHGGGFTGDGEILLASKVWLELLPEGVVEIKIGSVEMGQGTLTVLPQIVADVLDIPLELVRYHVPNTAQVANSGPTVASRTVMIVGKLLKEAGVSLRKALKSYHTFSEYQNAVREYLSTNKQNRFQASYHKPEGIAWDEAHFYGNGYDGYSLGCYVAEVEVDPVDYRVKVTHFYAYQDVGEVINPVLAQGQVEGGVAQGIGYALYERVVYQDGKVRNTHLSDYTVPLAGDLPHIESAFLNKEDTPKGLGELPMNGPAAAVANALTHALGTPFDSLTITPEKVEEKCR